MNNKELLKRLDKIIVSYNNIYIYIYIYIYIMKKRHTEETEKMTQLRY